MNPLVTIMIATRGRPQEVAATLSTLRAQTYPTMECLIIDDASETPLEPVVRSIWPDARVIRKGENRGQCLRRSEGFQLANGKYILQLDDDACFTKAGDLAEAVRVLEEHAEVGVLTFQIFNGRNLPETLTWDDAPHYTTSFVGCGALIRKTAVEATGGYRTFFGNEWEEDELCLRLIKAKWAIYVWPCILIHHRVSPVNRNSARTWMRGLRNKLWSYVMHYPAHRLALDAAWAVGVGCLDAVRLMRPHRLVQALALFLTGLPRAISLRDPMSPFDMRRLDAVRFHGVSTFEAWNNPVGLSPADVWRWFRGTWWNRPRQRSFWDRGLGDTGTSQAVKFAHEYAPQESKQGEPR